MYNTTNASDILYYCHVVTAVKLSLTNAAWIERHLLSVLQLRDVWKWTSAETGAHGASTEDRADKLKDKALMNNF